MVILIFLLTGPWIISPVCLSQSLLSPNFIGLSGFWTISPLIWYFFRIFFFFFNLGLHLQHMEGPSLGVRLELQLLAYTTVTAMQDLSRVCDLHHSTWQRQILNPLNEARDRTPNLMVTSQVCYPWATTGTPLLDFKYKVLKSHGLSIPHI